MQRLFSLLQYIWSCRHSIQLKRALVLFLAGFLIVVIYLLRPPSDFPTKTILTVRENATVSEIGQYLEDEHAIHSPTLFKFLLWIFNRKNGALSGSYYFTTPTNLISLSYKISHGYFGLPEVVFTVPEGTNIFQIADLASKTFRNFDSKTFLMLAKSKEGYLFPETYHFSPTPTPQEIVAAMEETFLKRIATVQEDIKAFGKPLHEVIVMASYLEEEGRLMQTRRMIAGILWKRLSLGMPLQIDSTFAYVNGKNTYQLTTDDLQIDSPYNTYKYKGLTPTPISNPGLKAILAAVTPIQSRYLYFLSDKEGNMHYAVTHEEHVANKERYLR